MFRHCAAEFVLTGDSVTATHVSLNKGSRMEQIGCVETRQESREGGAWELSGGCRVLCSVLRAWYYRRRTVLVKDVRRNGAVDGGNEEAFAFGTIKNNVTKGTLTGVAVRHGGYPDMARAHVTRDCGERPGPPLEKYYLFSSPRSKTDAYCSLLGICLRH